MPPDLAATRSQDRCGHRRIKVVSAQLNGHCGRAVHLSRRCSTNLSPMHAIHQSASVRPHDPPWTPAPHISLLYVVAEGTGS
jgi:hypothetical protein